MGASKFTLGVHTRHHTLVEPITKDFFRVNDFLKGNCAFSAWKVEDDAIVGQFDDSCSPIGRHTLSDTGCHMASD
jgi:hypothetical protein